MTRETLDPRLTRRTLLKGAAGAAALTALRPIRARAEGPMYDCIVLGAGIAGVTAARDLHTAGFRVLVVEGSDRIGGRMRTMRDFIYHPRHRDQAASFPLETGAEFIHIGKQNRYPEFFQELSRHGFGRRKYPKIKHNRLAFPDWKKNPYKLLLALLRNVDLIPTVTLLSDVDDYDRVEDMPAGAFVASRNYKRKGLRLGRYTMSSHTPGQLYDPAIDRFEPAGGIPSCVPPGDAVDTISTAGFKADRLPDQLFDEQSEYKIERNGELCGYDALPQTIAAQLGDTSLSPNGTAGEVLLGHRVVRIERRGERIAVITESGGESRELLTRSAICTFSAGVLGPAGPGQTILGGLLTETKRDALQSIRSGAITKFSLEFKKGHWGCFNKMSVMSHPTGCARTFFSAFPGRRRGPFVLTGLLMNQDHKIIQSIEDDEAAEHLLGILQSVLAPKKDPWKASEVLVARDDGRPNIYRQDWEVDPLFVGGNSYLAYRPDVLSAEVASMRQVLRDPRETLPLFWAGEATAPAYNPQYQPLSVHGAYISGVGAAADVRDFLAADTSVETFRNRMAETLEETPVVATAAAAEETAAHILPLRASERTKLEDYARQRFEGDVARAAHELCMTGVYLQTQDPGRLSAQGGGDSEDRIELAFSPSERQRIQELAQEAGLGEEEAVLALFQRGLRAAR